MFLVEMRIFIEELLELLALLVHTNDGKIYDNFKILRRTAVVKVRTKLISLIPRFFQFWYSEREK